MDSIVSWLLSKYIGDYFEGFTDNLFVNSNFVELKNLKIKKKRIDQFGFPIHIKEGILGRLNIKIPDLMDLSKTPVEIRIEDVLLLAVPKSNEYLTQEELEEQIYTAKLLLINMTQVVKTQEGLKEEKPKLGWLDSFQLNITENLQVFINKIHIRYEANMMTTPFSFGLTIDHLTMESVNENWKSSFVGMQEVTRKLVSLRNIAIYLDTREVNNKPLIYHSVEELVKSMDDLIYQTLQPIDIHDYILTPASVELRIATHKKTSLDIPKLSAEAVTSSVKIQLAAKQFHHLISYYEWSRGHVNRMKYLSLYQFLPKSKDNIPPDEKSRRWWIYAIKCVSYDLSEKSKSWRGDYILQRKNDRICYLEAYTKMLNNKELTPSETALIETIHKKYSIEEVLLFRRMAMAAHKVEEKKKTEITFLDTISNFFEFKITPEDKSIDEKAIHSLINLDEIINKK